MKKIMNLILDFWENHKVDVSIVGFVLALAVYMIFMLSWAFSA